MKRIFIAFKIIPGESLMKMISTAKAKLRHENIKWVPVENLHVTLAFLGDTREEKLKPLAEMLTGICSGFGEFQVELRGVGVFRDIRDPRVIWTGIEPGERLLILYDLVKKGLKDEGIILEERAFSPHLTLGRLKAIRKSEELKKLIDSY